ncbi:hypothetical protein [Sphingopyxis sp. 550A]
MAIIAEIMTDFGDTSECYIRLNNIDVSNHGLPARALFRGFLSKEAFEDGKHFVWEREIEFPADVSLPIWPQAYAAIVAAETLDPTEV